MVMPSLEAADRMAKEGVEVEVIDLRTLLPFDKAAIFRVARKDEPGRSIVHEDVKTLGIGAELSAVIMEERFESPRCARPSAHLSGHPLPVLAGAREPACRTPTRSRRRSRRLAAY